MKIKAYAKINLSLDIIGRRDDGYHEMEMIMQSISLHDELDIGLDDTGDVSISSDSPYTPCDDRNICYKAAQLFRERYDIQKGVHIDIRKKIPVSAGLAGGSTDAAATLLALRKLCKIWVSDHELEQMSTSLGADVPFCISGGMKLCTGIGEVLERVSLHDASKIYIALIMPRGYVSTKDAYMSYDALEAKTIVHPDTKKLVDGLSRRDIISTCKAYAGNVLEYARNPMSDRIDEIKSLLVKHGAGYASMSGSGPSVYGLFRDYYSARKFVNIFKAKYILPKERIYSAYFMKGR